MLRFPVNDATERGQHRFNRPVGAVATPADVGQHEYLETNKKLGTAQSFQTSICQEAIRSLLTAPTDPAHEHTVGEDET